MKNSVIFQWVWKFAKKYKWTFIFSYMILVLELVFNQSIPIFLEDVINSAVYDADMKSFLFSTLWYALVFFGSATCGYIQLQLWQKLNNKYVYQIRVECYRKVLHMKSRLLADIRTGDIISIINNDTIEFHHVIQRFAMRLLNDSISVVISLIIVAIMRWEVALLMLFMIPLSVFLARGVEKKTKQITQELRTKQGKYNAWLMEMLKGMREIKLFVAEKTVLKLFMEKNRVIVKDSNKQTCIGFQSDQLISGIYFISNILFYIISAIFVANGKINVGEYVAIATYYAMVINHTKHILNGNVDYQKRKASIERVVGLLEADIEEDDNLSELKVSDGDICIENLDFSYSEGKDILKNINLHVHRGEILGIVGQSGVGKSTFAHLLLKLYEPVTGSILIDGQDLSNCKYSSVRKEIGIVSQENIIFDTTVRENITLGFYATDDMLWEILEKASLKEEVERLPNGLDTLLGDRGTSLSGGQNQRLCIARMIFRNPKILILDEATSSLDIESEKMVENALNLLASGRTTIVISHRYQSLVRANRVLVLRDGMEAGIGSPEELMENNEYFRTLFYAQKEAVK